MKQLVLSLIYSAIVGTAMAQRVSRSYQNETLSDVLIDLSKASDQYKISFIYNDLEDFRVTAAFRNQTIPDAIRQVIGFYPISMNIERDLVDDRGQHLPDRLYVECSNHAQLRYKGRVVDEQGLGVEFANVALLSPTDSTGLGSGVSNADGYFVIPCEASRVVVRVSYVGYKTIQQAASATNLGTLRLYPETTTINGVTVKGYRPTYRMTGDGLLTSVENTALAHLGSAADVLEHLPLMQKSGKGELTVFGKGAPEIYINGRKIRHPNELNTLKSTDIKHVELITSPGARYDASVPAVVLIKTIAKRGDGFSFSTEATVEQQEHATNTDGELSMNYRRGGLDIFATLYYTQGKYVTDNRMRQDIASDTLWHQALDNQYVQKELEIENTAGVNYAIDDHNSVGAKYVVGLQPRKYMSMDNTAIVTANGLPYDRIAATSEEKTTSDPSHHVNTYYNGRLGATTIDLNVDFLYNQSRLRSHALEQSEAHDSRTVDAENKLRNRLFAAKIVLGRQWLGGQLDFGAEYTNTRRNDDYINPQHIVPTSFSRLDEQRTSPFVQYKRMVKGLGQLTVGMRYESDRFDYYKNGQHVDGQSRHFSNIFPSLSWAFKTGGLQTQLAYTTRTQRPTYRELSNNVTYANRFLWNSGNPALRAAYIHDLSLQGMYRWLMFNISFTDIRHACIWDFQQVEHHPVSLLSRTNARSLKALKPAIILVPKFGFYSPKLTMAMNKQWFRHEGQSYNNPIFVVTFDNNFKFSETLTGNILWSYQSKGHYQNVYLDIARSHLDLSVTKLLCHDRLSICLAAKDIFKGQKDGNHLRSNVTTYYQSNDYNKRRLALTVRYSFNTARSKYKGTGAGMEEKARL